ncbi:retrograde regulation protein 2 [Emydomyces testavorans]|uniref:Retrograde regulation protein 2 n=1 Tax=Emydomyces testavorans TaxID=2070801 RepID=A0AAF0DIE8_9EURO|nr:retrograde regulation protein 2 [Emydomyces testavorans]
MAIQENHHLHALVDMGSNGIRFSISNLSPPTSRTLPTVFQDRAAISLYDAQFRPGSSDRQAIPSPVQEEVIRRLVRFKETCKDFGVPDGNITALATEATRTAINSTEFLTAIKDNTGWDVNLLSKEEEGELGALGIASSLATVQGLVMDLGGGSTQISWMSAQDGEVRSSKMGSISFPYGAAAVTKRLEEAVGERLLVQQKLGKEMVTKFQEAFRDLDIPKELLEHADQHGGFDLFLSGGGFRGWGYLLLSQSNVTPYPIPIINGFKVNRSEFGDIATVTDLALTKGSEVFGVSDRRASQVPAVATLVNSLVEAIPTIKTIQFCQGGVREGYLFKTLPQEMRAQNPLVVATVPYQTPAFSELSSLLSRALPRGLSGHESRLVPESFTASLLSALANFMFAHSSVSKESRTAVALHSTTTGFLASVHGISHTDRALLALLLYDRWHGDLSPADQSLLQRLRQTVSMEEVWWCQYLGRVAAFVGDIYPSGAIRNGSSRIEFSAEWARGKKDQPRVFLNIKLLHRNTPWNDVDWLADAKGGIEKAGKKKNWVKAADRVDGKEDWGLKVDVLLD